MFLSILEVFRKCYFLVYLLLYFSHHYSVYEVVWKISRYQSNYYEHLTIHDGSCPATDHIEYSIIFLFNPFWERLIIATKTIKGKRIIYGSKGPVWILGWFYMKALRKTWQFFCWIFDQKSKKVFDIFVKNVFFKQKFGFFLTIFRIGLNIFNFWLF